MEKYLEAAGALAAIPKFKSSDESRLLAATCVRSIALGDGRAGAVLAAGTANVLVVVAVADTFFFTTVFFTPAEVADEPVASVTVVSNCCNKDCRFLAVVSSAATALALSVLTATSTSIKSFNNDTFFLGFLAAAAIAVKRVCQEANVRLTQPIHDYRYGRTTPCDRMDLEVN